LAGVLAEGLIAEYSPPMVKDKCKDNDKEYLQMLAMP
jgi:hypothetical protein